MHAFSLFACAAVIASAMAAAADAQRSPRGGPEIVLYDNPNFAGRSVSIDGDAPSLRYLNFNDRASSIRVVRGRWEVCLDAEYRGACQVIDADNPDMTGWSFNNRISSLRPVRFRGRDAEPGITLWSEPGFRGRRLTLTDRVNNLSNRGFNDQARSVEVHSGRWTLCRHDDFGGRCVTVTRDVSDLQRLGLDRQVTSLTPGEPPRSDDGYGPGPGPGGPISGGVRGVDAVFYPRPEIRGYPVAACLTRFGAGCGAQAADRLCRSVGHGRAVYFGVERLYGDVWHLDDRRTSRGDDALVDVLCES